MGLLQRLGFLQRRLSLTESYRLYSASSNIRQGASLAVLVRCVLSSYSIEPHHQVKTLRKRSGASILKCKEAISVSDGDIEKAVRWLRQTGSSYIQDVNPSNGHSSHGLAGLALCPTFAVVGLLGCNSDHAASTSCFRELLEASLKSHLQCYKSDGSTPDVYPIEGYDSSKENDWGNLVLDEALQSSEEGEFIPAGTSLKGAVSLTASILGEPISMEFLKAIRLSGSDQVVTSTYIHNRVSDYLGGSVVLMQLGISGVGLHSSLKGVLELAGKSLAMQVVCVVPKWLRMNDIPEEDRRMEINEAFDLLKASGVKQDDEKLRRISENKTNKAFEELVFENQQWRTFPYLLGHLPDFENWLNANSKLKPTVKVSEGLQLLAISMKILQELEDCITLDERYKKWMKLPIR